MAALREKFVADGFPIVAINSVKAAGLDLGAITPEEIALSILAEVRQCVGVASVTQPHCRGALVWGDDCQSLICDHFSSPCSANWQPSPRPDLTSDLAAARRDGRGWLQAIAKRPALDGHEHGGRLRWSGALFRQHGTNDDNSEGSSRSARREDRAADLYSVDPSGSEP
jgi:hypothetical protein